MARPSRMAKHPGICSSSFYLPRRLNLRFDMAINKLKLNGHQTTRSEILAALIEEWIKDPQMVTSSAWPEG